MTPYQVEFRPETIDDLGKLDKIIAQRILKRIKWLSENFDNLSPEMLKKGPQGLFKLRVGDWRVIYSVKQKERLITIYLIGHRKEVYK